MVYFLELVITTAPHLSAVVIIMSLRLASYFIASCFTVDKFHLDLFLFVCFILFMACWTRSIQCTLVWCVSLGFHFVLVLTWKGWYSGSSIYMSLASFGGGIEVLKDRRSLRCLYQTVFGCIVLVKVQN